MFVEATRMGGDGQLTLTGQLGRWLVLNVYNLQGLATASAWKCAAVAFELTLHRLKPSEGLHVEPLDICNRKVKKSSSISNG